MATSKKVITKKPAPKSAKAESEAPVTPEQEAPVTHIIDLNGGNIIRVFDLGPLFGIEKQGSTIDLIAKDGVSHFFRRSGTNIAYSSNGFSIKPGDSEAYVTIEEVEAECHEITDADRDRAKEALNEDKHKAQTGAVPDGNPVGILQPPTPRETAPEKKAEADKADAKKK